MNTRAVMVAVVVAMCAVLAQGADAEISLISRMTVSKGYLSMTEEADAKATMYGDDYQQQVTSYDTNEANVLFIPSGIVSGGMFFARNVSTNCNAVVTASFELLPGEWVFGRLLSTNVAIYAKTNGVPGIPNVWTNIVGGVTNVYTNVAATAVNVKSTLLER